MNDPINPSRTSDLMDLRTPAVCSTNDPGTSNPSDSRTLVVGHLHGSHNPGITPQHLRYAEINRNIDKMLSTFCQERIHLIEYLIADPHTLINVIWTSGFILGIDRSCLYQLGKFNRSMTKPLQTGDSTDTSKDRFSERPTINLIHRRLYRCTGCNNIHRLMDTERQNPNTPFPIECGRFQGKKLVVEKIPLTVTISLKTSLTTFQPTTSLHLFPIPEHYRGKVQRCSSKGKTNNDLSTFISGDSFTHRILITWYIDYIMTRQKLCHINRIYTAFICHNKGCLLLEDPDLGYFHSFMKHISSLTEVEHKTSEDSSSPDAENQGSKAIRESQREPSSSDGDTVRTFGSITMLSTVIIDILKQVFTILHLLQDYNFSSGGIDSNSLVFHGERVSYRYDGMEVTSDFTLKLHNLQNSGITVKSGSHPRLYHQSPLYESLLKTVPYNPELYVRHGRYRLTAKLSDFAAGALFLYWQRIGIGLYQSSFDGYSIFIMMMANPIFYHGIMNNSKLREIWKDLWLSSEQNPVQEDIKTYHSRSKINKYEIVDLLSKYQLRPDLVNHVWSKLKKDFI